jgi:hypothetical protein
MYRRALEGHLVKQRWYRPFGHWVNPGGVRRVVFMRTFRVVSESGAKETVVSKLSNLVALVVGQVPELNWRSSMRASIGQRKSCCMRNGTARRRAFSPMKRLSLIDCLSRGDRPPDRRTWRSRMAVAHSHL